MTDNNQIGLAIECSYPSTKVISWLIYDFKYFNE